MLNCLIKYSELIVLPDFSWYLRKGRGCLNILRYDTGRFTASFTKGQKMPFLKLAGDIGHLEGGKRLRHKQKMHKKNS